MLDLFAGTGAVGLEALSRGAAAVTFVESDRAASDVLRRNVETVGLPGATLQRAAGRDLPGQRRRRATRSTWCSPTRPTPTATTIWRRC